MDDCCAVRFARRSPRFVVECACCAHRPLVFFLLLISLCLCGCSSDRGKIDETKRRGDMIIRALEQFHSDRGYYPQSLADLAPKHIKELAPPTWGLKEWQYESRGSEFTLKVNESMHTGDGSSRWLRYEGTKYGWHIGD